MKTRLSFLVLFFLFQNFISAQQPIVAVSDQMNVIYMGIENPVTVAVEGIAAKDVQVTSDDMKVVKQEDGQYQLVPSKTGENKLNVKPKGHDIQQIIYRVKRIPDPIAKIGYSDGGTISRSSLLFATGIKAHLEGFDLKEAEVLSFEMTVQFKDKNKDLIAVVVEGGEFNEPAKELLNKMDKGDTVYFDNILARSPGDTGDRKINSMIFKVY